jgi:hypothetical protein
MADSPPNEDMDTSPEPSKVPGGLLDLKDQDESSEVEEEAVTLDLQPEGTEVFECPGNCEEYKPCGSDDCNALEELHITDDGEEGEGVGPVRGPKKKRKSFIHNLL